MYKLNFVTSNIVNSTSQRRAFGAGQMNIAEKFERLLDAYRRPDGRRWGGAELAEATGGIVHRSYVTNLRKGRIESPGYDKMRSIAKAMGFSPALWFEDDLVEAPNVEPYGDLMAALRDETVQSITRESARLPSREKEIVLNIVRQLQA